MIALWDLGNVVVRWEPETILERFGLNPEETQYMRTELLGHADWLRLDQGLTTESDVARRIVSETAFSTEQVEHCFDVIRESLTDIEASVDILQCMHAAAIPMYVLSNMSLVNAEYLRQREYFDWFAGVVISAEEKLIKPDLALFKRVIDRYALNAEEVFFVDDSVPNIIAAGEAGMQALHFKRSDACYRAIREKFDLKV